MKKNTRDFYIWIMYNCIKDTYEQWGTDMISMYDNIEKDLPNAAKAIKKIYTDFKDKHDAYKTTPILFEKPAFIYEVISNFIPSSPKLNFDIRTKEQDKEFKDLNMCSWNKFVSIERIDLLMAILLFTEEFIFLPISDKRVILTNDKLTVYGDFLTFKISKHTDKTYISIKVREVILLEYIILNK